MTFATSNNNTSTGVAARFGPAPAAQAQAQARSNPVAALSSAFKRARPLDPAFVAATATTINTTTNIHQSATSSVESLLEESVIVQVVAGSGMGMVDDDDMEVPVAHTNKGRARALLRQIFPEKLLYSDPSKDPRIFAL